MSATYNREITERAMRRLRANPIELDAADLQQLDLLGRGAQAREAIRHAQLVIVDRRSAASNELLTKSVPPPPASRTDRLTPEGLAEMIAETIKATLTPVVARVVTLERLLTDTRRTSAPESRAGAMIRLGKEFEEILTKHWRTVHASLEAAGVDPGEVSTIRHDWETRHGKAARAAFYDAALAALDRCENERDRVDPPPAPGLESAPTLH